MYDFDERDILFLRQLARDYYSGALRANPRQLKRPPNEAPIEIAIGKTTGTPISAGGSGNVTRWTVTSGAFAAISPTETVTAYDWRNGGIPANTRVALLRLPHKEGMRWIAIPFPKAIFIEFTLTGALAASDASTAAAAAVNNYFQGENPGGTVTLWNKSASTNFIFSGVAGAKGIAVYDDRADKYRIIQMECS